MHYSRTFTLLLWRKETILSKYSLLCESPVRFAPKCKSFAWSNEAILIYRLLKNTFLLFIFPENCWGMDAFSNNVKLLLLLYYTSMLALNKFWEYDNYEIVLLGGKIIIFKIFKAFSKIAFLTHYQWLGKLLRTYNGHIRKDLLWNSSTAKVKYETTDI